MSKEQNKTLLKVIVQFYMALYFALPTEVGFLQTKASLFGAKCGNFTIKFRPTPTKTSEFYY